MNEADEPRANDVLGQHFANSDEPDSDTSDEHRPADDEPSWFRQLVMRQRREPSTPTRTRGRRSLRRRQRALVHRRSTIAQTT